MRFALCLAAAWLAPTAFGQLAAQDADQSNRLALVRCDKMQEQAADGDIVFCAGLPITVLDLVRVSGDRSVSDPGSISIIDPETISSLRADHPAEILNLVPGVKIDENSGQESLIAIRSPVLTGGAGQGSFLVLTNGVPTRASAFGNVNMLFEPHLELAEAIEVIRGPASAAYGSNAVHGLVNVILPNGNDGNDIAISGSTLSRYRADGSVSGQNTWLGLSVVNDLGWRQSSGLDQYKLSGEQRLTLGMWDASAFFSISQLDQDTAGFVRGDRVYEDDDVARSNPNPDAFRQAVWGLAAIRLERDFGGGTLRLTPYLRGQDMEFSQHFLPSNGLEENGHWSVGLMSELTGGSDVFEWRVGADLDYASGYLRETQERESFGTFPQGVHYDYTVDTVTLALWGEVEARLSQRWTVLAGLRGETHNYDYDTDAPTGINGRFLVVPDRSDDFSFLTPKLGIIGDFGEYSVYANYARGARAPQATDLYRLQSLQERPAAEVETLDSLEVGIRGRLVGTLTYDIAAYAMRKEKFFFRDADGLNVTDGETEHFGIEAAWLWEPAPSISVSGNLAWSDQTYAFDRIVARGGETILDGNRIDTAPEWLADLAIDWQATEALSLGLSAEYVGEYFTDAENTRTYPGHTVVNGRAGFDLTERLEVFLIVRNLFDERYASRADFAFGSDRYFPGEPLNATFGVRANF